MQIAMYSSLSGGASLGNGAGEERFVVDTVFTLCSGASESDSSSPAKVDVADAAGLPDCSGKDLKVSRNSPSVPALNRTRIRITQAITKHMTRFDR